MSLAHAGFGAGIFFRLKPIIPYLVTAVLFAAGMYALYRLLAPVSLRDVMQQARATPASTVALALLATFAGYAALLGYDWSALRHIGKRLPMHVIALGGFLGYAFGNTIGLSAVSGGVVRYRIYSALGLDGFDVAAIATFASLSFTLGGTIVALGALAYHPDALQGLFSYDPAIVRAIAAAGLAGMILVLTVVAVRGSAVKLGRFRIRAPAPSLMAGQFVFTALDFLLAATTLYLLLPANDLGFARFVAIFIIAMKAGLISHVPGGVGVFESVILAALPASVPLDQAAAGLLLYRLIYYLVPFALALVLLSLSELRMAAAGAEGRIGRAAGTVQPIFRAVSAVVPMALAAMVFGSGLWMLVSALIPGTSEAADELELLLPLAFVEGGALLSSAIGAVLVIVAGALLRRIEGAFWLAMAALVAGAATALVHGLDYDRTIFLALAALVLLPCRREFYRSARLTRDALTPGWFVLIAAVIVAGAFVIFFANKSTPYAHELWWQFAFDERAPRAMRAGLVGSLGLVLALVAYALRPPRIVPTPPDADQIERAGAIVATQAEANANLVFTGDKSLLFSDGGDAFIMYGVHGRSWIAFGDPVGARAAAERLAWTFSGAAAAANARAVYYEVGERYLPLWIDMGLTLHKLGEEALVDLARFGLDGSSRKRLRSAHNRALRDGLSFEILRPPHSALLMGELQRVSDAWLGHKQSREKRFSVGSFDPVYIDRFPIAVVRSGGRIVAFANVLTTALKDEATIDLMRHPPDAPDGVMEFLVVELMLALKADGYRGFNLGMAPLSGLEARQGARIWTRFGALIFRHGGHFYNFEGLRRFKEKFDPDWRPRYIAAPSGLPPLVPLADAAILIAGGVKGIVAR